MLKGACSLALIGSLLAGCASLVPDAPEGPPPPEVTPFSVAIPGERLPKGWRTMKLSRFKNTTNYRLVKEGGGTVVHAHADSAASGLVYDIDIDPKLYPMLRWRWKVKDLIPGADNTARQAEDSPVRVIVTFSGDRSKWEFSDRIFAAQLRMVSSHELPYATLIYIWENKAARETLIPNAHTSRVKMIVARSGRDRLGDWCDETRNVYEDYRRAFGEEPPRVTSIGIMTDSDNTGTVAQGFYGDIRFGRSPRR
jgi:hypothetical protein